MEEPLVWTTEKRKVSDLKGFKENPRHLSNTQREHLKRSLDRFNLVEIPAIDADNTIIAGNQRVSLLDADKEIDVRVPNRKLTDKELKEYSLISNRVHGEFVDELLMNFGAETLEQSGFSKEEIDKLFGTDDEGGAVEFKDRKVLIQYSIIFNNEAEQETWFRFLRHTKTLYPDIETISERVIRFVDDYGNIAQAS